MSGKKIKNKKGFTLSELLVAIIVLSLMTVMLATGAGLAARSYRTLTDESNAQVLVSTFASMLRNELSNAKDVELSDGVYTYQKGESNSLMGMKTDSKNQVMIGELGNEKVLISNVTATNDLYVSVESIEYSDAEKLFSVKGIAARRKSDDEVISSIELLLISNN